MAREHYIAADETAALLAAESAALLRRGLASRPQTGLVETIVSLARKTDAVIVVLLGGRDSLAWAISGQGLRAYALRISSAALRRSAEQLLVAPPDVRRRLLERIATAILPADLELSERYVFVVDRDFAAIPFAALPHPKTRQPLIADASVGQAPTLTALAVPRSDYEFRDVLAVMAPWSDPSAHLPHALWGAGVFEKFDSVVALESPSPSQVTRHLERAEAFHYGGHLRADPLAPWRQELPLRPDGPALPSSVVFDLDLSSLELAVLASCDSAATGAGRIRAPSYADAFLLAGAGQVVGTLWPVEDSASHQMMRLFWGGVASGLRPMDALAEAARTVRPHDAWGTAGFPPVWMAYRVEGSVL